MQGSNLFEQKRYTYIRARVRVLSYRTTNVSVFANDFVQLLLSVTIAVGYHQTDRTAVRVGCLVRFSGVDCNGLGETGDQK